MSADPVRGRHLHAVDGLCLDMPVPLPAPCADDGPPDWTVEVERRAPEAAMPCFEPTGDVSDEGEVWARYGRAGEDRRVVLSGRWELVARPSARRAWVRHADGAAEDVRVLRHLLPYLAALDGRLVLHAACVVLARGAVLLAAPAGTGKSTLALALGQSGRVVLSDDHVVLSRDADGRFRAHPSLCLVEAWREARAAFAPAHAGPPGKAPVPTRIPPAGAVPVAALFFLRRGGAPRAEPVGPAEVVRRLLADVLFVGDPASETETARRFEEAAALARAVPAHDVEVPQGLAALRQRLGALVRVLERPGASGARAATRRRSDRVRLVAILWVALARTVVSLLPLGAARRVLARVVAATRSAHVRDDASPADVGHAVSRATRAVPRATCLVQALAAQAMLARRGRDASLHLGARLERGALDAHAWLECDGEVVVGTGPGATSWIGTLASPATPPVPGADA